MDAPPGIRDIRPEEFLTPVAGDASTLRSLDNLSQIETVALNILFLFALLSVLPTASHFITARGAWSQRTLATTWLLTEVMDPIGFFFGFMHWRPPTDTKEDRRPVQKTRAASVILLALIIMGTELVFIIGQATREQKTDLPMSQFRMSVSPETNMVLNILRAAEGEQDTLFATVEVEIPGISNKPTLTWAEKRDYEFFPGLGSPKATSSNNCSASFRLSVRMGELAPALKETPSFAVFPERPLNTTIAPRLRTTVTLQGLAPILIYQHYIPFTWIGEQEVQDAFDVVVLATGTEQCDWRVFQSTADPDEHIFNFISNEEECFNTITAETQRDITSLLSRLLSSRIRVGSDPRDGTGTASYHLVDRFGVKDQPEETFGLSGQRQIIPNTILIILACLLSLLALLRIMCLGRGGKYAERDFALVAGALGWDQNSSFARVSPTAKLSSISPPRTESSIITVSA